MKVRNTAALAVILCSVLFVDSAHAWPFKKQSCVGDYDGNSRINLSDLSRHLALHGTGDSAADLNCSGATDEGDTDVFLSQYGGCYTCKGDVDGNGRVTGRDLKSLRARFGRRYPPADFNRNGVVDLSDLSVLLSRLGQVCHLPKPCDCPDVDQDGVVGASDLALTLSHVGQVDEPAFDFNGDERIDGRDVQYVRGFVGISCSRN